MHTITHALTAGVHHHVRDWTHFSAQHWSESWTRLVPRIVRTLFTR